MTIVLRAVAVVGFVAAGLVAVGASIVMSAAPAGAFCDARYDIDGGWKNIGDVQLVEGADLTFDCYDMCFNPRVPPCGQSGYVVRLSAACHAPDPCDWGASELEPYELAGEYWYRTTYAHTLANVHVWIRPYDDRLRVWTWVDAHGALPDTTTDDWLERTPRAR